MAKSVKCKECAGTGYKLLINPDRWWGPAERSGTCPKCGGTGRKRTFGRK